MKRLYYALLVVCISVFSFNCQREISYDLPDIPNPVNNAFPVKATLQGNILDEAGQPAAGVMIKVGTKTTTTNARGYFRIVNATCDRYSSVVTAEKAGYFKAYRTFHATSGVNQVIIKLIKKSLAGTFSTDAGGEITLTNGTKIILPVKGVVKAAGGDYSGTVNVYAAYIDPTSPDISQTVPGSFMANDKDNKRVALASYGMLAVEMESGAGEKLQIAQGLEATLILPVPASLQSSAPSTIALWHVNEQTGFWEEEGTATRNGNNYTGKVKHFSFWNCDIGIPAFALSLTLKNSEGLPVVHALVRIKRISNNGFSYGITDSSGQVSGLVPANESLLLEVLDPCGNLIYSQNINPLIQNTDLGVITINNPGTSLLTVKGQLKNCNNAIVTHGFAIIYFDNITRYAAVNSNGEFAVSFAICPGSPNTVSILGVDSLAQQQGAMLNFTVTSPVTDAGDVVACGTSALEYISYNIDGNNYSLSGLVPGDAFTAGYFNNAPGIPFVQIIGYRPFDTTASIAFRFYNSSGLGGNLIWLATSVDSLALSDSLVSSLQANTILTNNAQVMSEFYEGNFSGQFQYYNSGIWHNINCSFRVRRDN